MSDLKTLSFISRIRIVLENACRAPQMSSSPKIKVTNEGTWHATAGCLPSHLGTDFQFQYLD